MNLRHIIADLYSTDESLCIVAKRPWSPDSEAALVRLTEDYRVPTDIQNAGYEYFLEVSVAVDEVLGDIGRSLSPAQREGAILYYAENDAYPTWLGDLRE